MDRRALRAYHTGMAGQPILAALVRYVTDHGGDRFILDQLADGTPVGRVASAISLTGHGAISRPLLYKWRDQTDDRRAGWAAAMKDAAHAHAEDAGQVWDDLPEDPTTGQVATARGKSEYKRWLATVKDREHYGPPASAGAVNVHFNLGELHVEALRQAGNMDHQRLQPSEEEQDIQDADYTVEDTP